MRLSTLAELAGFACLSLAAWRWNATLGVAVAGLCLLLIGYATEDQAAGVAIGRLRAPVGRRWATHRLKVQGKREQRARAKKTPRREPQEVTVRVKAE